MGFNLNDYETVEERLTKFWGEHPEGRIATSMEHYDEKHVVFRAEVYQDAKDEKPKATGYAEEVRGSGNVNKTNHLENCETSAIGRALANMNYATKGKRPSREEMEKASGRDEVNGKPKTKPSSARAWMSENSVTSKTPSFAKLVEKGWEWESKIAEWLSEGESHSMKDFEGWVERLGVAEVKA